MDDRKIEPTSRGQSMRVVKINKGICHIEHDSTLVCVGRSKDAH